MKGGVPKHLLLFWEQNHPFDPLVTLFRPSELTGTVDVVVILDILVVLQRLG